MTSAAGARATSGDAAEKTMIQKASLIVGATFILVGIAGFIPGITTDYDDLGLAGPDSKAMLLGLFQVSILHNVVHLAFGVLGVVAAKTIDAAKIFLIGGGLVYLLLFVYGLIVDRDADANFVPLNNADDWLHLILAIGMIGLGIALDPRRNRTAR